MEEIERMSYVVPASKEAIISGYKHILYGIMFDPFDEGEDIIVPNKTLISIIRDLAELSTYEIDIEVVGFFVKNITAGIPIKKRYKMIEVMMRQGVKESGHNFYARAQSIVPLIHRRDSLLLPFD